MCLIRRHPALQFLKQPTDGANGEAGVGVGVVVHAKCCSVSM